MGRFPWRSIKVRAVDVFSVTWLVLGTRIEIDFKSISLIHRPSSLGTLDALFADTEAETVSTVRLMFAEISRVLKFGGRYLCLTLAQDFIAEEVVNWFFQDKGWILRIQRVFDMEQGEKDYVKLVFVCVKG